MMSSNFLNTLYIVCTAAVSCTPETYNFSHGATNSLYIALNKPNVTVTSLAFIFERGANCKVVS